MKTLIWSVAWGNYRYMLQALMNSIKTVGIEHDLLTFSDEPLSGVISLPMDSTIELDRPQYWKFHYLSKLKDLNYDLFVFIDSDHFFVRKPNLDFSDVIGADSWHSFLESPLNSSKTKRADWWSIPNADMVELFRNFGVTQKTIYNSNGGFWICKKEFIQQAVNTAFLFNEYQKSKGLKLPEEVAIAVMSHLFSLDYEKRFHKLYRDYWATEWTGVLKNSLPHGEPWDFVEYMSYEKSQINPAIVHAMRSKDSLTEAGQNIFSSRGKAEYSTNDFFKK